MATDVDMLERERVILSSCAVFDNGEGRGDMSRRTLSHNKNDDHGTAEGGGCVSIDVHEEAEKFRQYLIREGWSDE